MPFYRKTAQAGVHRHLTRFHVLRETAEIKSDGPSQRWIRLTIINFEIGAIYYAPGELTCRYWTEKSSQFLLRDWHTVLGPALGYADDSEGKAAYKGREYRSETHEVDEEIPHPG